MDSDVYTASYTFQIIFTSIWCEKKNLFTTLVHFYYNHSLWRGRRACEGFAHVMNSNWKTLIPMSECYLFLPQAAFWAAGSLSTAAWHVIDIKELRDSGVVVRRWSWYVFMKLLSEYLCDTASKQACFGSVLSMWVCVWSLTQPGWWED